MQTENYSGDIPRTPLKFIAYISQPYKWWAFGAFITMVIAISLEIFAFYVIARFVDAFTEAVGVTEQLDTFVYWGTIFFVVVLIERAMWRISGFVGIKWLVDSHAHGNNTLYTYLVSHSHNYFSGRFAGAVSNKVTNAVGGELG